MVGKTLSHYKVIEKIGHQGGMGEVYSAEDTNLSPEVAIKLFLFFACTFWRHLMTQAIFLATT